MSMYQRLVTFTAAAVIVCAAVAQVAPTCCKYLWDWPTGENPYGACSGDVGFACQSGVDPAGSQDPEAIRRDFNAVLQEARCTFVVLSENQSFVRQSCSFPPPSGAKLIAVMPNGQCCYVTGIGPLDITYYNAGYQIPTCEGYCSLDGVPH